MADNLSSIETGMSTDEKKCQLKILACSQTGSRTMKTNFAKIVQMKYLHTKKHLVYCKHLIQIFSDIPEYEYLFNRDMNKKVYIGRILRANHTTMEAQKTI